jgi:hypothetical protein
MERMVAKGAGHPTAETREAAIAACRKFAPVAPVVDDTDGAEEPVLG